MRNRRQNGGFGGILDEVLRGAPHVRILRYLCRTGGDHTGRAIGRAIQMSHPAVHRALRTLAGRSLVQAARHGSAITYRLNDNHWLVRTGIRPLFNAEAMFLPAVGEAVRNAAGVPVRSVILFGSLARGEATLESDMDLLCLTDGAAAKEGAERHLLERADFLRRKFGRRFSVLVLPASDFARRYAQKERLAREIVESSWAIAGESLTEILRR